MRYFLVVILLSIGNNASAIMFTNKDVKPTVETGSNVYKSRCVICHGKTGSGDGLIPLKIKDYPSANLLNHPKYQTEDEVREAIIYGGSIGKMSPFMPPMGNDLTWTEMESVVQFITLLRSDQAAAALLINKSTAVTSSSLKLGSKIFSTHCTLCHGKLAQGDGRMSKVVKSPPPANLVKSRLPDEYLKKIIPGGGQSVGRSPQMPPWNDQFNDIEMESIILYIKSIRN